MTDFIRLESSSLAVTLGSRGARLVQLTSKRHGVELLLDSDGLAAELIDHFCIGGTVGPYAGRLRSGHPDAGESTVLLHGGEAALHRLDWRFLHREGASRAAYVTCLGDGDGGLPGDREFGVVYTVDDDRLIIDLTAKSSRDTPISMTNHAYFTLGAQSVRELSLRLNAQRVLATDSSQCPTGEVLPIAGTHLDFTCERPLADARTGHPIGLDHSYVLESAASQPSKLCVGAQLQNRTNGISLTVATSQPCLQVYTATQLTAPLTACSAICLEAQGFPNGPNLSLGEGTSILKAGDSVTQRIIYQVGDAA